MLATNFCAGAVHSPAKGEPGRMAALKSSVVVTVPRKEAIVNIKNIALAGQLVRTVRDIGISFGAPDEPEYICIDKLSYRRFCFLSELDALAGAIISRQDAKFAK